MRKQLKTGRLQSYVTVVTWMLFVFLSFSAKAQTYELTGTVRDESKTTLPGVNVLVKGTTRGVPTDIDGNFRLEVNSGEVLVISFIGYQPREIPVTGQRHLDIILKEETSALDEVVVVGYGTLKKSDLTGAVSSVDVDDLSSRATTNPAEALQGQIAGVSVQKFGGTAGSDVYVKIRGVNTYGDNTPLYIIDGFPGDINLVNPSDIQSMEILKDGAAAAIYGSRAANGVVLVTTKGGRKGEVKVDLETYLNFKSIANNYELLNAEEYVKVHKQMYENAGLALPAYITSPGKHDTDWMDAVYRSGFAQNYSVSVRGGGDVIQAALSANINKEKGIVIGNDYTRQNARLKINMKKNIFTIEGNAAYNNKKLSTPAFLLSNVYEMSPLVPVYDETQKYGFGLTDWGGLQSTTNPVAKQHFESGDTRTHDVTLSFSVAADLTEWLQFKTGYSYRNTEQKTWSKHPDYIADPQYVKKFCYYDEERNSRDEQVIDNILTFNKEFGVHSLNVMVGSSIDLTKWSRLGASAEGKTIVDGTEHSAGFLDPDFSTIDAGKGGTYNAWGTNWEYNRVSFFGRLNYSLMSRYMLQVTVRRDGSSKFGEDSRWGTFPSVAVGWRITEEDFFPEDSFVSNLKFRASWGRLGNEIALGYYDFQSLMTTDNSYWQGYVRGDGTPWPGTIARGIENSALSWETTDSKNIGFDYGFFGNALSGSINYYYTKTKDLLIERKLAPSAGMEDPVMNVGTIKNSGIEFEINYNTTFGEGIVFGAGFNLSTTKNEVLKLANDGQVLLSEGLKYGDEHFPGQTRVGKPVGAFYLYRVDGIFQSDEEAAAYVNKDGERLQPDAKAGDIRFADLDGNGILDDNDKEYCGSGIPKVEANLSLNASWKGFDFSMLLGSAWGHKLYNGNRYFYEGMYATTNLLKSTLNAWTPQHTHTDVPRAVHGDPNGNARESDRFLEKGNFVRLRQIQLGYTVPKLLSEKIGFDKMRIYVSGENLCTWTKYNGIDPEFARSSVLNTGIDNAIYPFTRSFICGLQLTF